MVITASKGNHKAHGRQQLISPGRPGPMRAPAQQSQRVLNSHDSKQKRRAPRGNPSCWFSARSNQGAQMESAIRSTQTGDVIQPRHRFPCRSGWPQWQPSEDCWRGAFTLTEGLQLGLGVSRHADRPVARVLRWHAGAVGAVATSASGHALLGNAAAVDLLAQCDQILVLGCAIFWLSWWQKKAATFFMSSGDSIDAMPLITAFLRLPS